MRETTNHPKRESLHDLSFEPVRHARSSSVLSPSVCSFRPVSAVFTLVRIDSFRVLTKKDIEDIRASVESICKPLGRRVKTIVNYDNFAIVQELEDDYIRMVKYVVAKFYTDVTRYTTSAFLRMKLGDELKRRDMAPHIFQSKEEARQALEKKE